MKKQVVKMTGKGPKFTGGVRPFSAAIGAGDFIFVSGFHGGEFDDAAFPAPVQPEALQVVEQIVTPRDRGEQLVHLLRAMLVGLVEFALHGAPA